MSINTTKCTIVSEKYHRKTSQDKIKFKISSTNTLRTKLLKISDEENNFYVKNCNIQSFRKKAKI